MKKITYLIGLFVCAALVSRGAERESEITLWRGSIQNGDKPGIGILLEVSGDSVVSGYYCLLDPDHPECFSVGRIFVMQNIRIEKLQLQFTLTFKKSQLSPQIMTLEARFTQDHIKAYLSKATDLTNRSELLLTKLR